MFVKAMGRPIVPGEFCELVEEISGALEDVGVMEIVMEGLVEPV